MMEFKAADIREIRIFAETLALRIGKTLRESTYSGKAASFEFKGQRDLVTEYDLWSEQEVEKAISSQFPTHMLIGEETSYKLTESSGLTLKELIAQNSCWIVDPIDGTTNFSNAIPHYAISLGFAHKGKLLAGVVYDPCRQELFSAELGQGATLNGNPIQVSKKEFLQDSVVATGFPYEIETLWGEIEGQFRSVLTKCRDIRRMGAASLDICYVACGRFDAYFEHTLKPWDIAAGHLIVSEAGGHSQSLLEPLGSEFSLPCSSYCCGSGESFIELLGAIENGRTI